MLVGNLCTAPDYFLQILAQLMGHPGRNLPRPPRINLILMVLVSFG